MCIHAYMYACACIQTCVYVHLFMFYIGFYIHVLKYKYIYPHVLWRRKRTPASVQSPGKISLRLWRVSRYRCVSEGVAGERIVVQEECSLVVLLAPASKAGCKLIRRDTL